MIEGLFGKPLIGRPSRELASLLISRYVYVSFHYDRDIRRVQQVKNHWVRRNGGYHE